MILGLFQIDKNLRSLERCQSLEETQRLYEAGDHRAVVCLLRPTLCPSGFDRAKHLEFMTSVPERPAQLLLLQVCAVPAPLLLVPSAWPEFLLRGLGGSPGESREKWSKIRPLGHREDVVRIYGGELEPRVLLGSR